MSPVVSGILVRRGREAAKAEAGPATRVERKGFSRACEEGWHLFTTIPLQAIS